MACTATQLGILLLLPCNTQVFVRPNTLPAAGITLQAGRLGLVLLKTHRPTCLHRKMCWCPCHSLWQCDSVHRHTQSPVPLPEQAVNPLPRTQVYYLHVAPVCPNSMITVSSIQVKGSLSALLGVQLQVKEKALHLQIAMVMDQWAQYRCSV